MKAVILDAGTVCHGDLSWSPLDELTELTIFERTSPDEVWERCCGCDIVLTNKVALDAGVLAKLPQLKYIGVLATGYNVVDLEAAGLRGVVVTNIPAYSTDSVAQMVWAHVLNITNRVGYYAEADRKGRWTDSPDFCYYDFTHTELVGKVFGIVGLGHTGMAVARIAKAFGMKVMAFSSKDSLPEGIEKADMDTLFRGSDVLSLHCPLTESTRGLVNSRRLRLMKPTAILINTSRGPVVDEADVARALNEGVIAAYGADVLSSEPPSKDNPLLTARNCFITPHVAWATKESRVRLIDTCIGNVKAFMDGKPRNVVN